MSSNYFRCCSQKTFQNIVVHSGAHGLDERSTNTTPHYCMNIGLIKGTELKPRLFYKSYSFTDDQY